MRRRSSSGGLDRPDRRDHLPLRPRRAAHAGPGERRNRARSTAARPATAGWRRTVPPASRASSRGSRRGRWNHNRLRPRARLERLHGRTSSREFRSCRAPRRRSTWKRLAEWRSGSSKDWPREPSDGTTWRPGLGLDAQLRGDVDSRSASSTGSSATRPSAPTSPDCSNTSAGPRWPAIFARSWRRSGVGGTTSAGFATTARPADRRPPWLNWSERTGAQAPSLVWTLRHAVAIQANRMPVLRSGLSTVGGRGRRGRGRPTHRLLRVLPRLPEDVRRPGQRGPPALGLVLAAPRHGRPRPGPQTPGRVALRSSIPGRFLARRTLHESRIRSAQ